MCPQKLMKIVLNMLSIDLFLKFDRGMDKCENVLEMELLFIPLASIPPDSLH